MVSKFHPAAFINALFSIDFKGPKFRAIDLSLSLIVTAVSWYFDSWIGMALGALGVILWFFNPIVWVSGRMRGRFVKPAAAPAKAQGPTEIERMREARDAMAKRAN